MSDDNDGGISLEGLVIPFHGFLFEILEKSFEQNEKVFGVRAKSIGVNSMLYNVPSLGCCRKAASHRTYLTQYAVGEGK